MQMESTSSESGSSSSTSSTSSSSSGSSSGSSSSETDSSSSEGSSDSDQKKKTMAIKKIETVKKSEIQPVKTKPLADMKMKENQAKLRKMPVINKSSIYSDTESDEGSSPQKSSTVRKPITKPKSSATVTPAPKLTQQKNVRSSPKKSDSRRNSRSKTPAKEHIDSIDLDLEKKHKSIFSPERPDTPPPPKLTPMKNVSPPKKTMIKPRRKASVTLKKASSTSEKSRTSSISSSGSSGNFQISFFFTVEKAILIYSN